MILLLLLFHVTLLHYIIFIDHSHDTFGCGEIKWYKMKAAGDDDTLHEKRT